MLPVSKGQVVRDRLVEEAAVEDKRTAAALSESNVRHAAKKIAADPVAHKRQWR